MPYLFLALFADLLHAHPLLSPGAPAIGIVGQGPSASADRAHRIPDAACAICQLQRIRPRQQAKAAGITAALTVPTLVMAVGLVVPKSPVPHPSAFRGPPRTFVS